MLSPPWRHTGEDIQRPERKDEFKGAMEGNLELSSVLVPVLVPDRRAGMKRKGNRWGEQSAEPGVCFTGLGEPMRDKEPIVNTRLYLALQNNSLTGCFVYTPVRCD